MGSTMKPILSKNGLNGCNDLGDIKARNLTENLFIIGMISFLVVEVSLDSCE